MVGQQMAVSFGIKLDDSLVNGAVEVIRAGEGLMSEVMPLQVAPDPFNIVHWSFEFCWAWLRQRSLFDRGVYGSGRAADVGFEPLVMRRRRSRAGLDHEQGRFSCGLWARGGKPGYRGTGGQARP